MCGALFIFSFFFKSCNTKTKQHKVMPFCENVVQYNCY